MVELVQPCQGTYVNFSGVYKEVTESKCITPYQWYNLCSHVRELDTAGMEGAYKKLSVFSRVFMFTCILCLRHLLLQHQDHLKIN